MPSTLLWILNPLITKSENALVHRCLNKKVNSPLSPRTLSPTKIDTSSRKVRTVSRWIPELITITRPLEQKNL